MLGPWDENPFLVLGLGPDASRAEVERTTQRLIGLLALGAAGCATYDTPLGPRARTPERVRMAAAQLRDPVERRKHELWATPIPTPPPAPVPPLWPGALRALGWRQVPNRARANHVETPEMQR